VSNDGYLGHDLQTEGPGIESRQRIALPFQVTRASEGQ
jgi:hypothetical protein